MECTVQGIVRELGELTTQSTIRLPATMQNKSCRTEDPSAQPRLRTPYMESRQRNNNPSILGRHLLLPSSSGLPFKMPFGSPVFVRSGFPKTHFQGASHAMQEGNDTTSTQDLLRSVLHTHLWLNWYLAAGCYAKQLCTRVGVFLESNK